MTDLNLWGKIQAKISNDFGGGEDIDLDGIIFLIGTRELGLPYRRYKKDEKLDLMHIAICRLLEPYGYYHLTGLDEQGWPHYELKEQLPHLKPGEQAVLMKKAIIRYFQEEGLLD